MKYAGVNLSGLNKEYLAIPKCGQVFKFVFGGVMGFDVFNKLVKRPEAQVVITPTGSKTKSDDPTFIEKLSTYHALQKDWLVLESLRIGHTLDGSVPETEFETVDENDPETWGNWIDEMAEVGFSAQEISSIIDTAFKASGLTQSHIEEATKDFLATVLQRQK